ncbi:hypothetical protein STEG23_035829 [Scotinomys teguina]
MPLQRRLLSPESAGLHLYYRKGQATGANSNEILFKKPEKDLSGELGAASHKPRSLFKIFVTSTRQQLTALEPRKYETQMSFKRPQNDTPLDPQVALHQGYASSTLLPVDDLADISAPVPSYWNWGSSREHQSLLKRLNVTVTDTFSEPGSNSSFGAPLRTSP